MCLALHTLSAFALVSGPSCEDSSWSCTAGHLLQWLYMIAGVLGVVLVLVTLLAVRLWRKNKDADEGR